MRYVLGVDGGATKTLAVVGDEAGHVLGVGLSGPTNYQITGLAAAMENLSEAVSAALSMAGLELDAIRHAVFGLAGADFPVDFDSFNGGIRNLYPDLRFQVVNDTWVGFKAGTEANYGGVVISGSGANYAAAAPDGRKVTGRGIGYEWGSEGGAGSLIRQIIHHAFRSYDGTGPKTGLEDAVLQVLGFPNYDDLSLYMYQVQGQFGNFYTKAAKLVPTMFSLALTGDRVAQDILVHTGQVMGEIIGGMMARLDMEQIPVEVVLVGSIFTKGVCPLMISAMKTACQRRVPLVEFRPVEMEPAGGAYLMALEAMGIDINTAVRKTAIESLGKRTLRLEG